MRIAYISSTDHFYVRGPYRAVFDVRYSMVLFQNILEMFFCNLQIGRNLDVEKCKHSLYSQISLNSCAHFECEWFIRMGYLFLCSVCLAFSRDQKQGKNSRGRVRGKKTDGKIWNWNSIVIQMKVYTMNWLLNSTRKSRMEIIYAYRMSWLFEKNSFVRKWNCLYVCERVC